MTITSTTTIKFLRPATEEDAFSPFRYDLFFSRPRLRNALEVGSRIQLRLGTMKFVANWQSRLAQNPRLSFSRDRRHRPNGFWRKLLDRTVAAAAAAASPTPVDDDVFQQTAADARRRVFVDGRRDGLQRKESFLFVADDVAFATDSDERLEVSLRSRRRR